MKILARKAVERPVTFFMTSLIVIGFGLFGLSNLRLDLYPDVSFPTITVYTTYEGVAPEDMETLITRPIEEAVGSISGVRRVRSISNQGASVVKLNFNWGTDLYIAESDVRKELDFVRRTIPDDAEQPIVFSYDPNQEPVIVLTLTSNTRSSRELRTIAKQDLEQQLERIPGVASAETSGGYERQINIDISNEQMRSYNLSIATIGDKLQQENIQVPAGELIEGRTIYSLRTMGEFENVDQIRNTIIAVRDGEPLQLKDVATVEDGIAQPIGNVHIEGHDGVILNIYRQSDANVVTTANAVENSLDQLQDILPGDIEIDILTNRAEFIEMSIDNLLWTGLQAVILVVLILLAFLRSGRSALIIAISIPVSIIATFSVMDWAELSLNIISLSGLTLAVGMVVDDAVVVLENIFRFKEEGQDRDNASILGAQEVAVPVVISTLTTLVVFIPILFVPGIAGFLFRDLALTLSFALSISSLVALTLIPLMSSQLLTPGTEENKDNGNTEDSYLRQLLDWSRGTVYKRILAAPLLLLGALIYPLIRLFNYLAGTIVTFFSSRVGPPVSRFLDRLEHSYKHRLSTLLDRSGSVVIAAVILFLVTLPVFNFLGGEFFPNVDDNSFILDVRREPGVSLLELERSISRVEQIIRNDVPEARLVVSDFGDKEGIEGAENPGGYQGTVRVELVPQGERRRSESEILAPLLDQLEQVAGTEIKEVQQDPLSPEGENGLIVQIYGYEIQQKQELADAVKQRLREIKDIVNVFSTADQGRPELRVVMDRERISRIGMTTSQVATALSNAVKGDLATTYVDKGIEFEVLVQLHQRDKAATEDLRNLQVETPDGNWTPLSNLARIERYNGPTNILRINQERVTEVTADLSNIDLKEAADHTRQQLDQMSWPEGYRYEIAGSAEDQQASFNYLLIAFVIAGILTYMVMASQFESLVEPFIIILTIPLALTGVLLMLWVTGTSVSVTSMVGLILLSGIVVNNGIVMIDYIKILQARKVERSEAIIEGAGRRLRPILMTAVTTILSMVPLALELGSGSETWSPMARTVIGGLTMSTLLMLFVVPCLYKLINTMVEHLGFDSVHKEDPISNFNVNKML
ncbi:hydrophobic/amphiphilic exporter-1, HAE1 family [Fodinibius roseus]|uniref:Hydrophobic/amphiphilic exporter-1, HAE1 family n=1 Tax=Fodinibius roseus TaxID=1194090 RepID=A0A1M5H2S9_9BACT|nr:efflux RND transporter permease subunit [Fodinibius roseus]SHG10198.1 hydrophobic/amphiphilic exporter-1, HAE1 family [Fodinibius roseus]